MRLTEVLASPLFPGMTDEQIAAQRPAYNKRVEQYWQLASAVSVSNRNMNGPLPDILVNLPQTIVELAEQRKATRGRMERSPLYEKEAHLITQLLLAHKFAQHPERQFPGIHVSLSVGKTDEMIDHFSRNTIAVEVETPDGERPFEAIHTTLPELAHEYSQVTGVSKTPKSVYADLIATSSYPRGRETTQDFIQRRAVELRSMKDLTLPINNKSLSALRYKLLTYHDERIADILEVWACQIIDQIPLQNQSVALETTIDSERLVIRVFDRGGRSLLAPIFTPPWDRNNVSTPGAKRMKAIFDRVTAFRPQTTQ